MNIKLFLAFITFTQGLLAAPVCEYHFDGSGTNALNSVIGGTPMTFYDANENVVDLHSAAGQGVSGFYADRCLDNRAATGMGGAGIGGRGVIPDNFDSASSFTSITLQCWFKAETTITEAARLFDAGKYVVYGGSQPGNIWLQVNGTNVASGAIYAATNQWMFFAVTYDSTLTNDNVVFYKGTTSSAVNQIAVATVQAGAVPNQHPVGIGNVYYGNIRPFQGEMDDVRIFAAATGGAGAATLSQLEFMRESDVDNIYNIPLSHPREEAGKFLFEMPTVPGWNYTVFGSTNLADWQTLTNLTGNGVPVVVLTPNKWPRAFYRVIAN